jgi:hypothetical protein
VIWIAARWFGASTDSVHERNWQNLQSQRRSFAYQLLSHSIDHLITDRLAKVKVTGTFGSVIAAAEAEAILLLRACRDTVAVEPELGETLSGIGDCNQ